MIKNRSDVKYYRKLTIYWTGWYLLACGMVEGIRWVPLSFNGFLTGIVMGITWGLPLFLAYSLLRYILSRAIRKPKWRSWLTLIPGLLLIPVLLAETFYYYPVKERARIEFKHLYGVDIPSQVKLEGYRCTGGQDPLMSWTFLSSDVGLEQLKKAIPFSKETRSLPAAEQSRKMASAFGLQAHARMGDPPVLHVLRFLDGNKPNDSEKTVILSAFYGIGD